MTGQIGNTRTLLSLSNVLLNFCQDCLLERTCLPQVVCPCTYDNCYLISWFVPPLPMSKVIGGP